MSSEPPASVLILKPSSFGDIIHTLPAVSRLKAAWPSTNISWLVNPEWQPLLEGNSNLAATVTFPRREFRGWRGWQRFYRWQRQQMRALRPDLVLDFQGLLRSAVIGRLCRPRRFYGMTDAREGARWLYDRVSSIPEGVPHSVARYLALTDFALTGEDTFSSGSTIVPLHFPLPEGEPLDEVTVSRLNARFVLLHPYSRGLGKSLTARQIEDFCHQLAPCQTVVVGRRQSEFISLPSNALDLLDQTTLGQLIWIVRRARFVISVDSGPSHLAAALARPLVAIHFWSDPRRVGPPREDAWVWKSGHLLQMRDLSTADPDIFTAIPVAPTSAQIETICALATSPSGSCA